MINREGTGRGIDVIVGIGVALLLLELLAMAIGAAVIAPRFGAEIEWMHPQLFIPIAIMVLVLIFAIEALVRKRSETAMLIHGVTTLLTFIGVPVFFVLLVLELIANV
ncbi:MAG: hypothetical protein JNM17_06635 [Archangium sp.]|nr:hypothetical protein [Archangium sp.]